MEKLKLVTLLGFLGMYACTFAQTDSDRREKLTGGFKVGGNYSNVWDEQNEAFTADGKAGFVGGVFLSIPIGKYLGVQPEILFAQKGFKGQGEFLGSPYSYQTTTNYLDVPLMVQFKPLEQITLLAGPQFSFLLSQEQLFQSAFYTSAQLEEYENNSIRKNVMGAQVGMDFNINQFVIAPRYGFDLQENHGDGTSSTPRYKNYWLQITVGFRF